MKVRAEVPSCLADMYSQKACSEMGGGHGCRGNQLENGLFAHWITAELPVYRANVSLSSEDTVLSTIPYLCPLNSQRADLSEAPLFPANSTYTSKQLPLQPKGGHGKYLSDTGS
jgi:hypothetical protein